MAGRENAPGRLSGRPQNKTFWIVLRTGASAEARGPGIDHPPDSLDGVDGEVETGLINRIDDAACPADRISDDIALEPASIFEMDFDPFDALGRLNKSNCR